MPDAAEHDRIREHFADQPGVAEHVHRAVNELDNAVAYGHESDEQRARDELKSFGYTPRDEREREEAAAARREAAAAKKAERSNGDADGDKGPEGRSATPPARQTTAAAKK